jgi:mannose-6-phosphate isomerase-like protein (cupin superfamily)
MRHQQRQREINPLKIRKHSDIVAKNQEILPILGDRIRTDYGFYIAGFSNKAFETKFITVVAGSATPSWKHDKKVRTFRVVTGGGQVVVETGLISEIVPLSPGTEFVAQAGMTYQIIAASYLELFVTQEYRYEANLQEVAPGVLPAKFPDGILLPPNSAAPSRRDRSQSRAREQSLAIAGQATGRTVDYSQAHTGEQYGINAKPIDPRTLE